MILPDSVDAQITTGIAFPTEASPLQQTDRGNVVGNTGCFQPVQPQRAEAVRYQRAYRRSHITLAGEWCTNPISNTARLRHAPPYVGKRQSAYHSAIVAAKD